MTGTSDPVVPLGTVPPEVVERLDELGALPMLATVPSYRAMSHRPELLMAWVEMSCRLRDHAVTTRALRELAIVRTTSQTPNADFETLAHQKFALESGISPEQLDALAEWQSSPLFSDEQRAVLALADAMIRSEITDVVAEQLARHFDPPARIELILTCGFYSMVPRVNDALRVY